MAASPIDLSDRAALQPLARVLAAVRKQAGDPAPGDRDRQLACLVAFRYGLFEER